MVFQKESHILDRRRALEKVDRHGVIDPTACRDLVINLFAELIHGQCRKVSQLGRELIFDQVHLARHPAPGRFCTRFTRIVQFQKQ
ncbi:hypothetical protein D3C78_928810 [compost metagenome]